MIEIENNEQFIACPSFSGSHTRTLSISGFGAKREISCHAAHTSPGHNARYGKNLNGVRALRFTKRRNERRLPQGEEISRGLVIGLVGFGEVEDAGLDKGFDGLLDEFRLGFVFEGGLDLVFKGLAGGGAGR